LNSEYLRVSVRALTLATFTNDEKLVPAFAIWMV
jgi:hypothetical protein